MRALFLTLLIVWGTLPPMPVHAKSIWELVLEDPEATARAFDQLYETFNKMAKDGYAGFKRVWGDLAAARTRGKLENVYLHLSALAAAKMDLADDTGRFVDNRSPRTWQSVLDSTAEFNVRLGAARSSFEEFSFDVSRAVGPQELEDLYRSFNAKSKVLKGYQSLERDEIPMSAEDLHALDLWQEILYREAATIRLCAKLVNGFIKSQRE